jgi:cytochrome c oxidase subunit 1/cytochrome c oxidase subunit I+III
MWDEQDREADRQRLTRGDLVLEQGHETPASTVLDADWDEVLEMPAESWAPIATAFVVLLVFMMLLTSHYVVAAFLLIPLALVLSLWHSHEPELAS